MTILRIYWGLSLSLALGVWGCSSRSEAPSLGPALAGAPSLGHDASEAGVGGGGREAETDAGAGGRHEPVAGAAGAPADAPEWSRPDSCRTCDSAMAGASSAPSNPWVVYQADDDTRGVQEIYAVQRDQPETVPPIRLHEPLAPDWQVFAFGGWAPDPELYLFTAYRESSNEWKLWLVYFDEHGPSLTTTIDGTNPRWSPSGRYLAVETTDGVSIYENRGAGELARTFHQAGKSDAGFGCRWAGRDQLFFSVQMQDAEAPSIVRAAPLAQGFRVSTVVSGAENPRRFEVSPDASVVTFERNTQPSSLYAADVRSAGKATELAGAGAHLSSWSPDSAHLLVVNSVTEPGGAFLGAKPYTERLAAIAPSRLVLGGAFTPDSSRLMLWEPSNDALVDIELYDLTGKTALGTLARQGRYDGGPYWADDDVTAVVPTRTAEDANRDLSLIRVGGRGAETLDSIPASDSYAHYMLSPSGEFVVYTKGVEPSFDGYYVDLRDDGRRKPVRLPGDGTVWEPQFERGGPGLYYLREGQGGVRECLYLDLSERSGKAPLKMGRSGRVSVCAPQPV